MIALGKVDSMLKVNACLQQGKAIGMLADRTLDDDVLQPVMLLGESANLPLGPFRMAAILRRPVFFMVGLYLGGNRYRIHFEPLADFSRTPRGQRQLEMQRALARYAEWPEKYCPRAPHNRFTFFNFWPSASAQTNQD